MLSPRLTSLQVTRMYARWSSSGLRRFRRLACLCRSTLASLCWLTTTVTSKGFGSLNFDSVRSWMELVIMGTAQGLQNGFNQDRLPPAQYVVPPLAAGSMWLKSVGCMMPPSVKLNGGQVWMPLNSSCLECVQENTKTQMQWLTDWQCDSD